MTQVEDLLEEMSADNDSEHLIFGIRHHSPSCARAVVAAAQEWKPNAVAIELPSDLEHLLPLIADPVTQAPVAVAVAGENGMGLYPFADFSPEMAIVRWAFSHRVPVRCIDLPLDAVIKEKSEEHTQQRRPVDVEQLISQESWDTQVEAQAVGQSWRHVRRAALGVGLGVRLTQPPDARNRAREAYMRMCLAEQAGARTLVVVGSYHCSSLVEAGCSPFSYETKSDSKDENKTAVSLIPYSFAQLDSRSGYSSGIRDPQWQQGIYESVDPANVRDLATAMITSVAREMRSHGASAGTGEVIEAARMAGDLARLRGLQAPGRREVVEALTSVFAEGSVIGRGRSVASALNRAMVGDRQGTLPPEAPTPALLAQVTKLLIELKLPSSANGRSTQVRIDPFKGGRDLERHVVMNRLTAISVPYVRAKTTGTVRGLETRSYTAKCEFTAVTAGALGICTAGATLEQAVDNTLAQRLATWNGDTDELLELLHTSVSSAAPRPLTKCLELLRVLTTHVSFANALHISETLVGLGGGREPVAALLAQEIITQASEVAEVFADAAVRELPGIAGSDELTDAALVASIVGLVDHHRVRALAILRSIAESGSPLMRGAATAVLVASESRDSGDQRAKALLGSWIDQMSFAQEPARMLTGYLLATRGTWSESPLIDGLISRVEQVSDASFVGILPRLRSAFDPVPPAERERFLDYLAPRIGMVPRLSVDPHTLAANAAADVAATERLRALGLMDLSFTPASRWRLVLGAEPHALGREARRFAATLDELYGSPGPDPSGESDGRIRSLDGARHGAESLTAREWTEEIRALFGEEQLQEIIGIAAERGRGEVIESLNPESVRPSIALLTTMLNLRGALPEARLQQLRPLIKAIVSELSVQLASELTPVLRGVPSALPTRRRTNTLDVSATIRRNLRNVVMIDGTPRIVPETPYFRSPKVHMSPWHIIVVVDVSGSMEASTIYAAMTAAILTGVRTYRVSFLTFNTAVVDLSDHVDDPLQLLLEISVGGGTDIAAAMVYAGTLVEVPTRTAIVLVTDFEERGTPVALSQQVRFLAESGVHLIGCAVLDDTGSAVYNVGVANTVAAAGMRVASVSPMELARWVGKVLQ